MKRPGLLILCVLCLAIQLILPGPGRAEEGAGYLVFAHKEHDFFDSIMRMAIDDPAGPRLITRIEGMNLWSPRINPEGTRLAFLDWVWGLIYLFNLEDGATELLDNPVGARSLEWSGDGRSIYFWGEDYRFYSFSLEDRTTTTLFNGATFWTWFNDGGFQVWTELDQATGQARDYLLAGYSGSGLYGKSNLHQLPVGPEEPQATELFTGLGDNYLPRRSREGRLIFQADDDRLGSHRCWLLTDQDQAQPLTGLYSGSPVWTGSGNAFVYVGSDSSNLGAAAYSGQIFVHDLETGTSRPQLATGQGATPFFFQPPSGP